MKFNQLCAMLLVGAGAPAFAVGPGALGTIDNMPIVIGNAVAPGMFDDVYTFVLGNSGSLSGGVHDIAVPPALNIAAASFGVDLRDATSNVLETDMSPGSFSFTGLSAGAYSLAVVGNAIGDMGGLYAGGVLAETAPVPEPETYALLLAGVGVVGLVASRRRQRRG